MFTYGNDAISNYESETNYANVGNVTIEMLEDYIPVYSFTLFGMDIPENSTELCGGSCWNFLNSKFYFVWA